MDIHDFKAKVANTNDEFEIDRLCWEWIKGIATDCGKDGDTALKLIEISCDLLSP